ncbi:hypothetical protein ACWJJH_02520 [Endozoicomonadaceae bacterium StTr2]
MKKLIAGLAIASTFLMTGCATRVADLTVASTKNANLNSDKFVTGPRVVGDDTKYIITFIPTGIPSVKEAVDKAIEKDHCAVALSDMAMDHESFYIPMIFGFERFKAEGNLVIDRALPGCESWTQASNSAPAK